MRFLTAAALIAIVASGVPSRADDLGPRGAVRSARDTSTDLLRPTASALDRRAVTAGRAPTPLTVYDVVTDGTVSVASWRVADSRGIIVLQRRLGLWWKIAALLNDRPNALIWTDNAPDQTTDRCALYDDPQAPTQAVLVTRYHLSPELAASAVSHNAILAEVGARTGNHPSTVLGTAHEPNCQQPFSEVSQDEGYRSSFELSVPNPPAGAAISRFTVRAPTQAEFPPTPGANSFYFFSFAFGGPVDVHVSSGSLDVVFPFVLDTGLRYSLTIGFTKPVLDPIRGRLYDNALHFDLPSFAATPGTSLMGEIEGDPGR